MPTVLQCAPQPPSWRRFGANLLRFLLAFALIPNLPFWFAAPRLGIATPGLINLDALLLGLLALFVRPGWVIALFSLDFLLDVVYGIRATFGTNYIEIFLSVRYLFSMISPGQLTLILAVSALLIAAVGVAWIYLCPRLRGAERRRLVGAVVLLVFPLALGAHYQRTAATARREAQWKRGMIVAASLAPTFANLAASSTRSPALSLYHAWGREHFFAWMRGRYFSTTPIPAASDRAEPLLAAPLALKPNFVLVLVEAWGQADDPNLRQSLLAPLQAPELRRRYGISTGLVDFKGTTAAGELRELCNRRLIEATAPLTVSPGDLAQCLPARLAQEGYGATALDSNTAFWPGGANWYKLLGFQREMTFNDFDKLGLPTFVAGPFRTTRDQEVVALLPGLLRAPAPQFVFMLTLSAHLPVHLPLPDDYNAPCGIAAVTRDYPQACGWYRIESKTLGAIAAAAAAPGVDNTIFLVVGDHAPPFVDAARQAFSPTQVPYVMLAPRP